MKSVWGVFRLGESYDGGIELVGVFSKEELATKYLKSRDDRFMSYEKQELILDEGEEE